MVYMAWNAHAFFQPGIATEIIRMDSIQMQASVPGMIVRYEHIVHAPRDGRVVWTVADHVRVREGVQVAAIQDVDAAGRTEAYLAELEAQMIDLGEMREATRTDPAVAHMNTNLRNIMDRGIHHFAQGNISEIYELLERTTGIAQQRNRRIIDENRHIRGDWERQYGVLLDQQNINSTNIYAPVSGVMSPFLDGYEAFFLPAYIGEINQEQVNTLIDHAAIAPVREVEEGDPVFKIISNNWYIATYINNEAALGQGFTVGAYRTIYLENVISGAFEPLPVRIHRVDEHPRHIFVVFRATRNVTNFLHQRNVNIRTTSSQQSGLLIPPRAVAMRRFFRIPLSHVHGTENFFVMLRRYDRSEPVNIHVAEISGGYAYILDDNQILMHGDALIPAHLLQNEYFISESTTFIVRGVYRANMGYADFVQIHFDEDQVEADGFILLNPARNPVLRQFDTIVSDATAVRQGQIVHR
jgi:hypothetical protein